MVTEKVFPRAVKDVSGLWTVAAEDVAQEAEWARRQDARWREAALRKALSPSVSSRDGVNEYPRVCGHNVSYGV